MNENPIYEEQFADIPCLREHTVKISTFLAVDRPAKSVVALRRCFLAFADWARSFEREKGVEVLEMPIDSAYLVEYAWALDEAGKAMSTISSYISGIGTIHTAAGFSSPTASAEVKAVLAKLREKHANDEFRLARSLSLAELGQVMATLRKRRISRGRKMETPEVAYKRAKVDLALLITMVQAGMGRAEAVRLTWEDVREGPAGSGEIILRTPWSGWRDNSVVITGSCFRALRDIRPEEASDDTSVFNLSSSQINQRLKRMCEEAGIDPKDVSGHTPRATLHRFLLEERAPIELRHRQLRLKPPPFAQQYARRMPGDYTLFLLLSKTDKAVPRVAAYTE